MQRAADSDGETSGPRPAPWRSPAVLWLLMVPLLLLGPIVFSGRLFLPQVPQGQEPLRSEDPVSALASDADLHYTSSDRLFPALTDQYAMGAALRAGNAPTWEPDQGLGIPLFAQSIAGPTYPPNWLAFFFSPERLAGPLAALSLLFAGLGAWLFLRRLGLTARACLLGALAYQLGGWGIANLYLFMKVDAALFLPWSLWALEGLAQRKRHAGLGLTLALALSLSAGFLPIGVFVSAASALYALLRLTPLGRFSGFPEHPGANGQRTSPPTSLRSCLVALLFGVLGIAAASLAIGPLLEVSGQSERQEQSVQDLSGQALPNSTLLGVALLDLFGKPTEATPAGDLPVAWWLTPKAEALAAETANPLEWNTYAGAAVLVLALVGLLTAPRRAAIPALLLLGVYGFALGWAPLRWMYALPGFDAGSPVRSLSLAWFLWPWLAAVGLDAIDRQERRSLESLACCGLGLLLAALALWLRAEPSAWVEGLESLLVRRYEELTSAADVRQRLSAAASWQAAAGLRSSALLAASMGALVFWCAALALLRGGQRTLALSSWMLFLCVLGEGLVAARGHLAGQRIPGPLFPPSPSIEAVREAAGTGRVIRYAPRGVGDVVRLARPNLLQPYGIADLTPWVVFPPKSHNDLFAAFDPDARYHQGFARLSSLELLAHPMLDLFCVSAVLSVDALEHPRLTPVLERPGFHVYRRSGALERARLVGRAELAPSDAEAPALLASGSLDFSQSTLLSAQYGHRRSELCGEPRAPGRIVSFERPANNRIRVRVEDSQGGYLVLHEQEYPGWRARRNGQAVEVLRADHAYQAVALQPGLNDIEFSYAPSSVRYGLWISCAALVLAAGLSWRLKL